jgi:hypothetical protein
MGFHTLQEPVLAPVGGVRISPIDLFQKLPVTMLFEELFQGCSEKPAPRHMQPMGQGFRFFEKTSFDRDRRFDIPHVGHTPVHTTSLTADSVAVNFPRLSSPRLSSPRLSELFADPWVT